MEQTIIKKIKRECTLTSRNNVNVLHVEFYISGVLRKNQFIFSYVFKM